MECEDCANSDGVSASRPCYSPSDLVTAASCSASCFGGCLLSWGVDCCCLDVPIEPSKWNSSSSM